MDCGDNFQFKVNNNTKLQLLSSTYGSSTQGRLLMDFGITSQGTASHYSGIAITDQRNSVNRIRTGHRARYAPYFALRENNPYRYYDEVEGEQVEVVVDLPAPSHTGQGNSFCTIEQSTPWGDYSGGPPYREARMGYQIFTSFYDNVTTPHSWQAWHQVAFSSQFTASHTCKIEDSDITKENIPYLFGRLVEINETKDYLDRDGWSLTIEDALPHVQFSKTRASKKVLGVISNSLESLFNPIQSVGEGGIWVCNEDGNIECGDYLMSSTNIGYATKQTKDNEEDGILRNYTVGKATCNCNFIIGSGNCALSSSTTDGKIIVNGSHGYKIAVNSTTLVIGDVIINYTGTLDYGSLEEKTTNVDSITIIGGSVSVSGNYPFIRNNNKGIQINTYVRILCGKDSQIDSCNTTMKLPCFEKDGIKYSFIGCIYTAG